MPTASAFDALQYDKLNLPYNRVDGELSETPRLFRGSNVYTSYGGKMRKRLGSVEIGNSTLPNRRFDRMWIYETMETPGKVYLVGSALSTTTGRYAMFYKRLNNNTNPWVPMGSLRELDESTRPHEASFSRGLMYIKGFPRPTSTEKLGTVIFDGAAAVPTTRFWGLLGPTVPARLACLVTTLTADMDSTTTTLTVSDNPGFPATPFEIQVEFERMIVSNVSGLTLTVIRGAGGTTPADHPTGIIVLYRDNWATSAHRVDVTLGWRYTYAYKTITGQYSNRAPLEANIDLAPSNTGPFVDLIPRMTLQGHPDTTNVPTIAVFRSTDGGGRFFLLKEIANPGNVSFAFSDTYYETGNPGGVFLDPLPDTELDTATPAPTLNSNSPPPTVLAPEVTGIDTPIASTPIAFFQGRFWIGLGNVLSYSALEELNLGIGEESWPSGLNGNFFRFQYPITNLIETSEALYVFTLQVIYRITGRNRETFASSAIADNFGGAPEQSRAITRYGDVVAFLTHDYRIATIENGNIRSISDPLFTDIVDAINSPEVKIDIKYWADLEKEYLFVGAQYMNSTQNTKYWIYDIGKSREMKTDFWFVPWSIRTTCMASGRTSETSSQRRLVLCMFDETTQTSGISRLDPTGRVGTDWFIDRAVNISWYFDTHLAAIPPGNHVNNLKVPAFVPNVSFILYDRTLFAGDENPQVYYYLDDFWTDPIESVYNEDPPRRNLSKAYTSVWCGVNQVCRNIAVRFSSPATANLFELHRFAIVFEPEAGA